MGKEGRKRVQLFRKEERKVEVEKNVIGRKKIGKTGEKEKRRRKSARGIGARKRHIGVH